MHKLARIAIILCACLLAAVAVRFSAAQKNASVRVQADGSHGTPSFPHFGDSDAKNRSDGDDIRGRIEASRAKGPVTEEVKLNAIRELQRQQQLYSQQLPGANAPAGIPSWISLGPTEARYETNDVTLKVSDSGRIRTILPHPSDPDTMYVLTSGGGLWKTATFTHKNPHWAAKTDALISTSGGSAAFGRNPNTLYLGIGDPVDGIGLAAHIPLPLGGHLGVDHGGRHCPARQPLGATARPGGAKDAVALRLKSDPRFVSGDPEQGS